ncbi:MAG: cystathionine beta-lyase [Deltaproteobacteria bacterium]|nr:cystathionine beta-lyase [Deltaproteobacteria bacterium]
MKDDTLMVNSGRDPERHYGVVNLPVYHASTVLFPTLASFTKRAEGESEYRGVRYGAFGTPTTFALADAVSELEGSPRRGVVVSSGQCAVTLSILAFVQQGDHILMVDTAYGPTRNFCNNILKRFGVETEYYDPLIGGGISSLMRPNTRLIFTESPGSLTFEIQDIPAIAAAAHQRDIPVFMDNTWGTPLFFKPFAHGVDISIQAGTKYISGASDLVIGIITARTEEFFRRLKKTIVGIGDIAGPDDCYLALRGLRSMGARLHRQQAEGIKIAQWFEDRPEVKKVLHPALPGNDGHGIWKRDFTGACSLFGVVLHASSEKAVARMIEGYRFIKIGASWGGYESLVLPATPGIVRTAVPWTETGYVLRYHIGLEDTADLIRDLEDGFARLNQSPAE